jgi:hypothetical protein
MRDPRGFPGRGRKTSRHRRDHHGDGEYLLPAQQERRQAKPDRQGNGNGGDRLTLRGEIESDAGAECDGHPGQQSPGTRLGAKPRPELLDESRPCTEPGWGEASRPRRIPRRPSAGVALRPAGRPARLCHPSTPCDPQGVVRLPEAVTPGIAERMQNIWGKSPHTLPPTSFAKVSRRPMVRLNTGWSGVESLSRTK